MTTFVDDVVAGVGLNMRTNAKGQELEAAQVGVGVEIRTQVYKQDGSKTFPTELAKALCETPTLARGTREDMASLLTSILQLDKPFGPARLSRALSTKAKSLVTRIMNEYGYDTSGLDKAIDIRDIIRTGQRKESTGEHMINTRFEYDGVWLGDKLYPYERVVTYENTSPWYYLGIRFARDLIQLKNVLAMRGIGINQFIGLDEVAHKKATPEQIAKRLALVNP